MSGTAPAGWYKDPAGTAGRIRYFDGRSWTDRVRDIPDHTTPRTTAPHEADPSPFASPSASRNAPFGTSSSGLAPAAAWTSGVAPGTTQALLAEVAADWKPKERPTWAEAGWYPDPGRSRKLRFYDGDGWTARIRAPLEAQMRALPKAAITARAKLLEIADQQATRSNEGQRWRTPTAIRIEQPQSLHRVVRGKSGRVGGMLSMAAVVVAAAMLMFAGWQQFGADTWQRHHQDQMREILAEKFEENGGEYDETLGVSSDPAPFDVERPQLPTTSPTPGTPAAPQAQTTPPKLNDRPADIAPFPPTGWTPPSGRKVRTLDAFSLGAPVGRLVIPRMGLDEVMVSGTGANELAKGPGVARYGMLPGSPGNAVIAGHRTGWGEPFRNIDRLQYGDQIIVEIPGQERAVYEVRSRTIVGPNDTHVVEQTKGVRLTLTTCHPVSVNTHRMIIQAEMIEGPWLDKAVNRSKFRTIG